MCENKSLYSVARDSVIGVDASWFINYHLRRYHGEIDEENHSWAVLRTLEVAAKVRKHSVELHCVFEWRVGVVEFDERDAKFSWRPLPANGNSLTGLSRCSIFSRSVSSK